MVIMLIAASFFPGLIFWLKQFLSIFVDVDFPAHFGLSDNFQDLMSRLLAKNPRDRISLEAIKQHSWWTETIYN